MGVAEWQIPHKALDTNGAQGSPESSRLDRGEVSEPESEFSDSVPEGM